MRLLYLGLALGVGGAMFVACGGNDFTAGGGKHDGNAGAGQAGVGTGGTGGASGSSGASARGGAAGTDAEPGGAGGEPPQGGTGGAGEGGEGGSGPPPECAQSSDCDDARGQSPCGNWTCNAMGECEASSP